MQRAMQPTHTTQELVRKAQAGDEEAFDCLAKRHRGRIEALARTRMSPALQRRLEVRDVVQETFLRALEHIDRFRWTGEDSFGRWLNGIARNVILKAAHAHSVTLESSSGAVVEDGHPSPSKVFQREERLDRLEEALKALTPEQRKVIRLARLQGLKAREIAARMGRTESAVKQLLLRGLRTLRREFGDTESLHLADRSLDSEGTSTGPPPEKEGDHG